jgi:hypothetical protein
MLVDGVGDVETVADTTFDVSLNAFFTVCFGAILVPVALLERNQSDQRMHIITKGATTTNLR